MTNQKTRPTHALIIGLDHELAERTAIWLALKGIRLIALSHEGDRLGRVKREIATLGGRFDFLSGNLDRSQALETCVENLIYQFDGVDCIINFLDQRWTEPTIHFVGLKTQPLDHRLIETYQSVCSHYRDVHSLKRVITVALVSQAPPVCKLAVSEREIAEDHVYLIALEPSKPSQTLSPVERSQIPVEWIGQVVLKRLLASQGSTTQCIELIEGEGILHEWRADGDTSISLGNAMPIMTREREEEKAVTTNGSRTLKR